MEVAEDFVDSECLTRFTDQAIEWIRGRRQRGTSDQPFFLYLPYTSPHYPVCPLPRFHGRGQAGAYGEFVIETDHHVGRLLQFLEQAGLDQNTLIFFSSDNGPENSWKQRVVEFGHQSNGIYREGKRSIYEGGHRVPLLVRWPRGLVEPGRDHHGPVGQIDILATLAEMVGADLPDHAAEDSQSFFRVLVDPMAQLNRRPIVHHSSKGRFAIRDGDWKLVMPHRNQPAELYHLAEDPSEEHDVIDQHRERAGKMTDELTQIIVSGRTTPGTSQPNDTGYWDDLPWMVPEQYDSGK
jgi:arylsulfatase A